MRRGLFLLLALIVLMVGAWARFHRIDDQSLWNDEGNSLRLAQRSPADLIDAAGRDIHPPGYYLALKVWIGLAGDSELSLRYLSALAGLVTVAGVIALGRALFGHPPALIAGLITALHPFAIYYSQETRMYAALGLWTVLSTWLFVLWLKNLTAKGAKNAKKNEEKETRPVLIGLTLSLVTAAGLYTQYSYPFTMLAQGLFFVLWILWRRFDSIARRALGWYAALNGLALILFLPWLPTAWDQVSNWPRTGVNLPLDQRLHTVLTWILVGNTTHDIDWLRLILPGLLILAVLIPSRRALLPYAWRAGLPAAWGIIVIGALFASGAYREANLKFLLPAQAAAALLIGRGAVALWNARRVQIPRLRPRQTRYIGRVIALVGLIVVLIGQLNALNALYTNPAYARDNYRGIAAQIAAHPRPGDAIILDAPNQAEVFTYYYHGDAPIYELPRGLGGDDNATRADVQTVIGQYRRIFVLFWGESERDPHRVVEATLDAGAFPVAEQWYGDVRLAQYAVLAEPPADPQIAANVRFGDHIALLGYSLSDETAHPGDALGVTLYWATDAPLDVRYKVTVQILAADGHLIAQHDAEPGGNRALTTTWIPGETVLDTHGLTLPPDLAPGDVTLMVALYDINPPASRLPVNGSDHYTLSPLSIR